MSRRRFLLSLAVALLPLVFLPAPPADADELALADSWLNDGARPVELDKVLVVAITTDAGLRRRVEDRCVSMLRGRNSEGTTSYSLVPDLRHIGDRGKIVDTLLAQEVQGVITVRFVPLGKETAPAWSTAWRGRLVEPTLVRTQIEESLAELTPDAKSYGVEVNLWSMQAGERLWAGRTNPESARALSKGAADLVYDIVNELVYKGLLK